MIIYLNYVNLLLFSAKKDVKLNSILAAEATRLYVQQMDLEVLFAFFTVRIQPQLVH